MSSKHNHKRNAIEIDNSQVAEQKLRTLANSLFCPNESEFYFESSHSSKKFLIESTTDQLEKWCDTYMLWTIGSRDRRLMQKSTIVTHTVDQGNLRLQITTKRENEQINAGKKNRGIFGSKCHESLRVCFCKRKDVKQLKTWIYNLPKLWGWDPFVAKQTCSFERLKEREAEK